MTGTMTTRALTYRGVPARCQVEAAIAVHDSVLADDSEPDTLLAALAQRQARSRRASAEELLDVLVVIDAVASMPPPPPESRPAVRRGDCRVCAVALEPTGRRGAPRRYCSEVCRRAGHAEDARRRRRDEAAVERHWYETAVAVTRLKNAWLLPLVKRWDPTHRGWEMPTERDRRSSAAPPRPRGVLPRRVLDGDPTLAERLVAVDRRGLLPWQVDPEDLAQGRALKALEHA